MHNEIAGLFDESVDSAIARLKAKGLEFSNAYAVHMGNYERVKNSPQLLAKWQSIKNYADNTKSVIQAINNTVDKSVNWLKDVFGFSPGALNGLQGVGALPLVPIAYVTGAIAALTYVVGEIYKFNQLVKSGATPDQLTKGPASGASMFDDLSTVIKYGAIAFGIYMLWQKFDKE